MFGDTGRRAVIIPVARVDNVSVATGSFLVSPPSPMAALGLMRKIEIDLIAEGILEADRTTFQSVALAVHEFEVSTGHRRIPPEMRGEHGKKAGAMLDDPEGHLLCTLVFSADIENPDILERVRNGIKRRLPGYRLAGGRIIRAGISSSNAGPSRVPVLNSVEAAWDDDQFQRIVRQLPPGAVLVDRTHDMYDKGDGRDALDRLLDNVALTKHVDGGSPSGVRWTRGGEGWMVPVQIGFRALSHVAERPGMRHGEGVQGHVWVEDVLGLGQWIKIRKCLSIGSANRDVAWRYAEASSDGPYLAVGTEF